MDPKEEIQKFIQEEVEKWENYDKKIEEFRVCQAARFKPLRILLIELIASVEPEYINANILEDRATIEVGYRNDCESRMKWIIEPNFTKQEHKEEYWGFNLWQKKINLKEAPGFKVEVRQGENNERFLELGTESEVIHHLAKEIAKRVAYYRYEKKRLL